MRSSRHRSDSACESWSGQSECAIQYGTGPDTAWTRLPYARHHARVRVLPHIRRLDDQFGDFLVRIVCECGACREIQPQALARLVGWKMTLTGLAMRMRCSRCGRKAAEVMAVAFSAGFHRIAHLAFPGRWGRGSG